MLYSMMYMEKEGGVCKILVFLWNRFVLFNNKGKRFVDCIFVFIFCGFENF